VINAFVAFDPISNNARVQNSLALLADGTESFTNISNADAVKKWPVEANDKDMAHKKACRIAVIPVLLRGSGREHSVTPVTAHRPGPPQGTSASFISRWLTPILTYR
jgi:hypothetical protein